MSFAEVTSELMNLYKHQMGYPHPRVARLGEADVRRWSSSLGVPRPTLYDQIALYLARGFHASELTFTFCDAVINDLYGVITSTSEHRPELFWKIYLAFDEGEYYHGNNRDEDPVDVYTRPMITSIIDGISSSR